YSRRRGSIEELGRSEQHETNIFRKTDAFEILQFKFELGRKDCGYIETLCVTLSCEDFFLVAKRRRTDPGDARLQLEHDALSAGIEVDIVGHFRTRPHETHFAFEDVPKLGKLIDFYFAQ